MQLVVEGPVDPRNPDEREHQGEVPKASPTHVDGQGVRDLRDQHDEHEIVEELDEADSPVIKDFAVGAGRSGEPLPKGSAASGVSTVSRCHVNRPFDDRTYLQPPRTTAPDE